MYRILVVDDDPAVLSCYGRLLQRAGHAVETAHGGNAALARLSTAAAFDVVIIDYRMPEMDGMEFLRQMRRAGHAPEVILVSAYVTDKVRESAVRMVAFSTWNWTSLTPLTAASVTMPSSTTLTIGSETAWN